MKPLPRTENSLVLRTDFSDDDGWASICKAIQKPSPLGFRAYVKCVSDPEYDGLTVEQLLALNPLSTDHTFVFIVDQMALSHRDRPILVVDLFEEQAGRTFRVIPSEMWSVENNLSLANMDFEDFADIANMDAEGIFRGVDGA
jgi:hypothetical protein